MDSLGIRSTRGSTQLIPYRKVVWVTPRLHLWDIHLNDNFVLKTCMFNSLRGCSYTRNPFKNPSVLSTLGWSKQKKTYLKCIFMQQPFKWNEIKLKFFYFFQRGILRLWGTKGAKKVSPKVFWCCCSVDFFFSWQYVLTMNVRPQQRYIQTSTNVLLLLPFCIFVFVFFWFVTACCTCRITHSWLIFSFAFHVKDNTHHASPGR